MEEKRSTGRRDWDTRRSLFSRRKQATQLHSNLLCRHTDRQTGAESCNSEFLLSIRLGLLYEFRGVERINQLKFAHSGACAHQTKGSPARISQRIPLRLEKGRFSGDHFWRAGEWASGERNTRQWSHATARCVGIDAQEGQSFW